MLHVIGIIPARFGSTRFPGKPLVPIAGIPLLQRCFENSRLAHSITSLVVATDDLRIVKLVESFGGEVFLTSPECATGSDRLAELLHRHPSWQEADAIVNIQGDEPCIPPNAIDAAVSLLLKDPSAVVATLATPCLSPEEAMDLSVVKCVTDQFHNALYFSRNWIPGNKKGAYSSRYPTLRHLGLYVYRPHFLLQYGQLPATPLQIEEDLEQLKILEHGYKIKVALCSECPPGVDTPKDIENIEQWICKKQNISSSREESALPSEKD